jgi:hypothetical protein
MQKHPAIESNGTVHDGKESHGKGNRIGSVGNNNGLGWLKFK